MTNEEFWKMVGQSGTHIASPEDETRCVCGEEWPCDAWVQAMEEGGY